MFWTDAQCVSQIDHQYLLLQFIAFEVGLIFPLAFLVTAVDSCLEIFVLLQIY